MFHFSTERIRGTNPKCSIRNVVLTNRSDPTIRVQLTNGRHLVYNTSDLTELEVLQHLTKTKAALDAEPEAKTAAA